MSNLVTHMVTHMMVTHMKRYRKHYTLKHTREFKRNKKGRPVHINGIEGFWYRGVSQSNFPLYLYLVVSLS